jgi:hypothetical protein
MGRNKLSRFHIFYQYFVPNGTDFHLSKTPLNASQNPAITYLEPKSPFGKVFGSKN